MPRRSLRTVLTVWNATALAVLLGVFGAGIVVTNQSRVRAQVDDSLRLEVERASRVRPPRPGQMGPNGQNPGGLGPGGFQRPNKQVGQPGGDGQGPQGFGNLPVSPFPPGPDGGPDRGPNQGQGQGLGQGPQPGDPEFQGGGPGQLPPGLQGNRPNGQQDPGVYEEAARLSDIRRPRFFDAQGNRNPNDPVAAFDAKSLTAALHGQTVFIDTQYQGEPIRVASAPRMFNGRVIGAVQVAQEVRNVDLLWRAQVGTLALFLPLAILAAAGGAYALTGRTLSPIRRLTRAASEISHSDLSRRLEVSGDDEIGELATTFNKMLARLETSFTEIEGAYSKMARAYDQQQRFTADAAHELRTPLTRLGLATSSALREAGSPEEMKRALQTADRAASSMTRLVQDLLTLAKADSGQLPLRLEPVDLRVIVAEALENVSDGRPIDTGFDERPLMISADAEHLQRVITNLTENACRHTPPDRAIRIETLRSKDYAVVSIRDSGEGIAAEHLPRIFDRFYRADAARTRGDGGSGLGLAICKNLVEAHGGRIDIESSRGVGTTVRTIFPLISAPAALQTKSS